MYTWVSKTIRPKQIEYRLNGVDYTWILDKSTIAINLKESKLLCKTMKVIDQLDVYLKIQNIQLLKLICYKEQWDYQDMIRMYKVWFP